MKQRCPNRGKETNHALHQPENRLRLQAHLRLEQSREVLIDFLDAVLYGSRGIIADLEILNPWWRPGFAA